jgi:hypothetical protein
MIDDKFLGIDPLIYSKYDINIKHEIIFKLFSKIFLLLKYSIDISEGKKINYEDNLIDKEENNNIINITPKEKLNSKSQIISNSKNLSISKISTQKKASTQKENLNFQNNLSFIYNSINKNNNNNNLINNDNNDNNNSLINQIKFPDYLLFSLTNFLKIFCKIFFCKNLNRKYSSIFECISENLKIENSSEILIFILNFLTKIITKNKFSNAFRSKINKESKKILDILIEKIYINNDYLHLKYYDNTINPLFIGNIMINNVIIKKITEFHMNLISLDSFEFYGLRKNFYSFLAKLLMLNCENPHNKDESLILFNFLIDFYVIEINKNSAKLKEEEVKDNENEYDKGDNNDNRNENEINFNKEKLRENICLNIFGLLVDSVGIIQKIEQRNFYLIFLQKYLTTFEKIKDFYFLFSNIYQLQNIVLKFFENLTENKFNRIEFDQYTCKKI